MKSGFVFIVIPIIILVIAVMALGFSLGGKAQYADSPKLVKATSLSLDGYDPANGTEVKIGRLTGYIPCVAGDHPAIIALQAGTLANCGIDRFGQPLYTLQDYLDGRAPYVSVAGSKKMYNDYPYDNKTHLGHPIRIPKLDAQYKAELERSGRPFILFRLVDTGSAFENAGYAKMDIHVGRGVTGPVTVNSGQQYNNLLKNAYAIDGSASVIFLKATSDSDSKLEKITGKALPVN